MFYVVSAVLAAREFTTQSGGKHFTVKLIWHFAKLSSGLISESYIMSTGGGGASSHPPNTNAMLLNLHYICRLLRHIDVPTYMHYKEIKKYCMRQIQYRKWGLLLYEWLPINYKFTSVIHQIYTRPIGSMISCWIDQFELYELTWYFVLECTL